MEPDLDERRVAIQAIATLVHIKRAMVDLLLKPAGVPPEVYRGLLYQIDPDTGRQLTKRQSAPLILAALESRADYPTVLRANVEIAANWNSFHLADDEFAARATVQKAREPIEPPRTFL